MYIWPEFAELRATRPITIHELHPTGMDCLNKTFLDLFYTYNVINRLYIHVFQRFRYVFIVHELFAWFENLIRDVLFDTIFSERSHPEKLVEL